MTLSSSKVDCFDFSRHGAPKYKEIDSAVGLLGRDPLIKSAFGIPKELEFVRYDEYIDYNLRHDWE